MALDYVARDGEIAKRLAGIQNAPPGEAPRVMREAFAALFDLGVEQSRREIQWCGYCEGRGYVPHTGVPFGVNVYPMPRKNKRTFCFCARGQELKQIYGVLGEWR